MSDSPRDDSPSTATTGGTRAKLTGLAILLVIVGLAYMLLRDALSLENLAQRELSLRRFGQQRPVAVYAITFSTYVLVTGLSLPGATVMSLIMGWYFGFVRAVILVSFASTLGATMAFLLSRFLLRDFVQAKWGERLKSFNDALDREGAYYLFTLRLIPAVPFFVINIVMGLTRIGVVTFWWVSQLGMLAATCVYVYAGSTLPSLAYLAEQSSSPDTTQPTQPILSWQLLVAFALLGLFPITVKRLVERVRRKKPD